MSGDQTVQSTDSYLYALSGEWKIGANLELMADTATFGIPALGGAVAHSTELTAAGPWNAIVGASFSLNRNWVFAAETGLSRRRQWLATLEFHF